MRRAKLYYIREKVAREIRRQMRRMRLMGVSSESETEMAALREKTAAEESARVAALEAEAKAAADAAAKAEADAQAAAATPEVAPEATEEAVK